MPKIIMFAIILYVLFMCSCVNAKTWQCINRAFMECNTWRMEIPSGWIVASDNASTGGEHGYAMVVVPDPEHQWKL